MSAQTTPSSSQSISLASSLTDKQLLRVLTGMAKDLIDLRNTVDTLVTNFNNHAHTDDGAEHATGTVTPTVSGFTVGDDLTIDETTLTAAKHHSTGTITLTVSGIDLDDTYTLNSYAFTAKGSETLASGFFNVAGTDAQAATSLAACINASVNVLIAGLVTATASGAVVTVRKVATGTGTYTHVSSDAQIAVSGAGTLTAGTVPVADEFDMSGSNAQCVVSIAAAIEANEDLAAIMTVETSSTVVTMTLLEFGAGGNDVVLTSSDAQLAVSGAGTFTGAATAHASTTTGPTTVKVTE